MFATIYQENGYADRAEYIACLADDYDLPLETVRALALMLGPTEDFDGLVTALEDEAERRWQ